MVATTQGKEHALKMLAERRAKYKDAKRIDNSSLKAGAPMYFYCIGCGAPIVVPESYVSKPSMCHECEAMHELGWLE